MTHVGCKNLDYTTKFINCTLSELGLMGAKVWERRNVDGELQLCQFCKLRGRINDPEACIYHGKMSCYEAQHDPKTEK